MQQKHSDWSVVCHSDFGGKGTVAVVEPEGEGFRVVRLEEAAASGEPPERRPVFFGVDGEHRAILMNAVDKTVRHAAAVPADAFPAYAYRDDAHGRIWFMNDGDKETGNDTLNCGDQGASVTIVERSSARVLKTLCVGRGHHVTLFWQAAEGQSCQPARKAFVSNLLDGTISVVGNDADDPETFLQIIDTINLAEAEHEDGRADALPNKAFPHGMVYSAVSGRLYNLNNGYGSIAVIDPVSHAIERRLPLKGCSNLLDSPDGRFLIGKGADRKSDPEHVIGRLVVIDAVSGEQLQSLSLPDYYPSVYRFSPDGRRLYLTSASTGKGAQRDNLNKTVVQVYDTSRLPEINLLETLEVGLADCGRRPIAFARRGESLSHVFIPNPSDGTLSIFDAGHKHLATLEISAPGSQEVLFSFWGEGIIGA